MKVCARFQLDGVPIQMNLDLARITDDYTEEGNAAGGGFALFNIMFESLEWFGVNCFQVDDGIEEQKDDDTLLEVVTCSQPWDGQWMLRH